MVVRKVYHTELGFNFGRLAQAEAPPAAIFSQFKRALGRGGAGAADVAFYFVHWLTDLSGAVPLPLEGASQIVSRFPMAVSAKIIASFGLVKELPQRTETEMLERYLAREWRGNSALGAEPTGSGSVAIGRLVLHLQQPADQLAAAAAFRTLPAGHRAILGAEMALTGIAGQRFASASHAGGPAFLVYYAPAFLRKALPEDATAALSLLAGVYRAARALWPATAGGSGWVTVRIDAIKDSPVAELCRASARGEWWVLARRNAKEAVVELRGMHELKQALASEDCELISPDPAAAEGYLQDLLDLPGLPDRTGAARPHDVGP